MNAPSTDIKDMLVAADIGLTFGANLFISREPSSPANCVTIYDTAGMADGLTFNREEIYEYPAVQVRVRNTSYQAGWVIINDIRRALHGRAETVNDTYYAIIKVHTPPAMVGYDDNGRAIIVINFLIQRR